MPAAGADDALDRARVWLTSHGADMLPWTRAAAESGAEHGGGIDAILADQHADTLARLVGLLICSQPMPDDEALHAMFDAATADALGGLLENSYRLLSLSLIPADASLQAGRDQAETLRRMTLAMARDVRVVMVRLASALQTLRRLSVTSPDGAAPARAAAAEALTVLAPLANRLGLYRIKWEMEDLAFRAAQPDVYRSLARQLESKRRERESFIAAAIAELAGLLAARGIVAQVTGRPKHLFSIHNKLQAKRLTLDGLHDLRGLRVLVDSVAACYATLDVVQGRWEPMTEEFDDYIVRPKANGYQSLHAVVIADDGLPLEVQIRTRAMHEAAEYGVAAHWRYKERTGGGSAGGGGAGAAGGDQADRIAWLRQLLAWQQEVGQRLPRQAGGAAGAGATGAAAGDATAGIATAGVAAAGVAAASAATVDAAATAGAATDDASRIYAMTPQGRVIELPAGATPVDFAYHVHSTLGHRCRGARVDGRLVPLQTPLANGQVVDIITARTGAGAEPGPSRDWLNPALGYVRSQRARAKVRQWFNAQQRDLELAAGRERVEKALAREGRTALSLDELAARLGRASPAALFADVARELIGARALEDAIRAAGAPAAGSAALSRGAADPPPLPVGEPHAMPAARAGGNAVLVVGVDFLLTQLARCCHPAPPDPIVGFVTRGKGVTVHRAGCSAFAALAARSPERVLPASWGDWRAPAPTRRGGQPSERRYPVALQIQAGDRSGLLRDITEIFARERANVLSVRSLTRGERARFHFIVEVPNVEVLERLVMIIRRVAGVESCVRV
ncbi:MAG: bifunctional (p)ppGpp synthetase/guanosine-3',5'-bis(diphosphate) 3'-pyrophosphohydrolase [Lautropia sp.]